MDRRSGRASAINIERLEAVLPRARTPVGSAVVGDASEPANTMSDKPARIRVIYNTTI